MPNYTIQSGDTLSALAKKWGVTIQDIMKANPSITNPNKIYAGKSLVMPTTSQTSTTTKEQQAQQIQQQIQQIQAQLGPLQAQSAALQKYGLTDTNQLMQDAQGNWVPKQQVSMPDEFDKYLTEAKAYYEPQRVAELSELEQEVKTEKQRLSEDWQNYLNDINTGKLRAGTDYEEQLRRQLEQKSEYIQQQEFNIKQNMQTLNRNWMQRGGLFSGARLYAGQQYMTQEQLAKQAYESGVNYNIGQLETTKTRALEDYATAQQKGQLAYTRGTEDVALQRIKDIRSLNKKYNLDIGSYMDKLGLADYRKSVFGY